MALAAQAFLAMLEEESQRINRSWEGLLEEPGRSKLNQNAAG
jgi:hypothetical protein